jgi:hypothetical protein
MKRIMAAIFLLACGGIGNAAVIDIPGDYATIKEGVDAAFNGDTIILADGVYAGPGNHNIELLAKSVSIISFSSPENTIIDAEAKLYSYGFRIYGLPNDTVTIKGITIKNAISGTDGSGLFIRGPKYVLIDNCKFENCYGDGGGVYIRSASSRVSNSEFINNFGFFGGGLHVNNGTTSVSECRFIENTGQSGGAVYFANADSAAISKCIFDGNRSGRSSIVSGYTSGVYFRNCTIVNNEMPIAYTGRHTEVTFANCILAFNYGSHFTQCVYGEPVFFNCDIYGNEGGDWNDCIADQADINGNFSLDPLFCDKITQNYFISQESPCNAINNPNGRLVGAFGPGCGTDVEYPMPGIISFSPAEHTNIVTDGNPQIAWTYAGESESAQSAYEIEIGTDDDWDEAEIWSSGQVQSSEMSIQYAGPSLVDHGHHFVRIRISDGRIWGSWRESEFVLHLSPVIEVPEDETIIQSAINNSLDGDTILISPGTYQEHINLMGKQIILRSTNGPNETIITKSQDGIPIISLKEGEDNRTTIDGFTVQNANQAPGIFMDSVSSATITNCIVQSNNNFYTSPHYEAYGGGIVCGPQARILGNIIRGNYCDGGGAGIYAPLRKRVEISGNRIHSNESYLRGAAIYLRGCSYATVKNNMIYKNYGMNIVHNEYSTVIKYYNNTVANNECWRPDEAVKFISTSLIEFYNNIIAFNQNAYGIDYQPNYVDIIFPVYECNNFFENELGNYGDIDPGLNDISQDPQFCDIINANYNIKLTSPCSPANNICEVIIGAGRIGCTLHCGDYNGDGSIEVSDVITCINYLFSVPGSPELSNYSDANCDGDLNISDLVYLINYIFKGGPSPCDINGDSLSDC